MKGGSDKCGKTASRSGGKEINTSCIVASLERLVSWLITAYSTFRDIAGLCRDVLLCKWFWLPVLNMANIFVNLWLMFFVHPLFIVAVPAALILYCLWLEHQEAERLRRIYKIS